MFWVQLVLITVLLAMLAHRRVVLRRRMATQVGRYADLVMDRAERVQGLHIRDAVIRQQTELIAAQTVSIIELKRRPVVLMAFEAPNPN